MMEVVERRDEKKKFGQIDNWKTFVISFSLKINSVGKKNYVPYTHVKCTPEIVLQGTCLKMFHLHHHRHQRT